MNTANLVHTFIGLITYLTTTFADSERCQFPREWKGKWYQHGLGEVIIRDKLITKKGSCYEHHRDYYLVKKRNEDCYQCLLIMVRHDNIIQYKESFCLGRNTLRNICAQITVERQLYTLVRDPAIATGCPFKDAYYFDYNDQASGYCNSKIAYAEPCAGHTKYLMHFKHCKEYAMFANTKLNFECLGNWKDGSDNFLYGRFSGHEIANKDESYRCFKYEGFGTEMYMAMSVDATCQGLRTPRDGPVTMEFAKDIYGWPRPACSYPHWLSGVTWRDIEGKHTISFSPDSKVMLDHYRRRMNSEAEIQSEHRCVQVLGNEFSADGETFTVFSFTTNNCNSKHQCLRFKRNKSGRMEVFKGTMVDFDAHTECTKDEHYTEAQIWMEENAPPVECPMRGSYLMQNGEGCHQRIAIGCQNRTLLAFSSTCDNEHGVSAFSLQCLLTWQESGRTYLLANEPGANSRLVNCFSFKERYNTVHFTTDRKCSGGASGILDKSVKYQLLERETCEAAVDHVILPVHPIPEIIHETTTVVKSSNDRANSEGDNPDYYEDIHVDYVATGQEPVEQPASEGSPRRGNEGVQRDRERGGRGDADYTSLADDIASKIRDDNEPDPSQEQPYPKYSQVDRSKVPAPTDVAGREQLTSAAGHSRMCASFVFAVHTVLALVLMVPR